MNQIILTLFFFITITLTACGQYGDLYAPPENPPQESTESLPENLQEQPAEAQEDKSESDK